MNAVEPMFTPQDWDQLVADHQPPNVLLVAVDETDAVVGYTAIRRTVSCSRAAERRELLGAGSTRTARL